jgi:hypothetical protein
MNINGNISQSENYLLNQEYSFEINRLNKSAVFKVTLLPTDDLSTEFLRTNPEDKEVSANYSCEHYVKSMAF